MWQLKGNHLIRRIPPDRELRIDLTGPGEACTAWYGRPGSALPLGNFATVTQAKTALTAVAEQVTGLRKLLKE